MSKLKLPPILDVPSITKSTVAKTVDAWFRFLKEGAHGVHVAPAIKFALKVYGQPVRLEAVIGGRYSAFDRQDSLIKDIARALWECSRGRNLDLRGCDPVCLPFRRDYLQFKFPVPGMIIEQRSPKFLCVLARKKPPFESDGYRYFGALLRLAVDRTPFIGADVEMVDLSAPNGFQREPSIFDLSSIRLMSEMEVDDKLAILADAYDILKTMNLPEPKIQRKKKHPGQGEFDL